MSALNYLDRYKPVTMADSKDAPTSVSLNKRTSMVEFMEQIPINMPSAEIVDALVSSHKPSLLVIGKDGQVITPPSTEKMIASIGMPEPEKTIVSKSMGPPPRKCLFLHACVLSF